MSIIFAVRGTSKAARYTGGNATPAEFGTNSVDAGDISSVINLDQSTFAEHCLIYAGQNSIPSAQKFSVLLRVAVGDTTNALQTFFIGMPTTRYNFQSRFSGAGTIVTTLGNNDGTGNVNQTYTFAYATATYYDLVWLVDTSITTGGLLLYKDGSLVVTTNLASTRTALTNQAGASIILGAQNTAAQDSTRIKVSEFVIWNNQLIDPTNVALTSGNGSLNGASRTAYVDVASFQGALGGSFVFAG